MSSNDIKLAGQKRKPKKKKPSATPATVPNKTSQNTPSTSLINNGPDGQLNGGKASQLLETYTSPQVDADLDNVLTEVKQLDNTCDFVTCRHKTTIIGHDCNLCEQRFCMKHLLPEVHGCGGAVKKTERAEFLRIPPKPTPKQFVKDHNKAQKRLDQKLKEMSLARKKNTK